MKYLALVSLALIAGFLSTSAAAAGSNYDPLETFAPFDYQYPVNRYRAANGMPGPDYWQNRADYEIHATLDPGDKTLSGRETITYTNNSPEALDYLWLQLDQNRYRRGARAAFASHRFPPPEAHTPGFRIMAVEVARDGLDGDFKPVRYLVTDTRMRVTLPQALKPNGGVLRLRINYSYTIPGDFGGRNGWYESKNGAVFEMAQWYPRMAVFDDLNGWNTLPFLNNEFYLEYGDFDYYVTVPSNMILVGAGRLMNPNEVLTETQRKRLGKARHSDKTVMIRSPGEVNDPASRPAMQGALTWHYRMENTRDVAFGASRAYVWDAARINLPSGRTALAMSVYPVESLEEGGWGRSTQFVKFTVEFFSRYVYEYPYAIAVAEAGTVGGMEYPGLAFDWWKAGGKDLFGLTVHEIGHTWFPMIVGSDERRNAWMDEGMNTFVDVLAARAYNDGEFAPKRDGEFAPGGGNPVEEILTVLNDPEAPPILTRAELIQEKYRHPVTYFKTALGLLLLRDQILGPERFDSAFRKYAQTWAFRHPSPSDFFRAMDSAAGEDLDWFWNGWFRHNWKLDMAVTAVKPADDPSKKGVWITVANLDRLVMPAVLQVNYADGSNASVRIPVAAWTRHDHYDVFVAGDKRATSVVLDPEQVIPDGNRSNNTWPAKAGTDTASHH